METSVLDSPRIQIESVLPTYEWRKLAETVKSFAPHVVVLVARKMPRLMECLGLDFGKDCVVISDLAIPFAYHLFRDSRVAIIDDVVNVGTTLANAHSRVLACGAQKICLFALAAQQRDSRQRRQNLLDKLQLRVRYASYQPFDKNEHVELSWSVPRALGFIAKPYDLEFPLIACHFTPPFSLNSEIFAWLQEKYGKESVHRLNRPKACDLGLSRFTVDIRAESELNTKLRLYLDEKTQTCNLVPFCIPPSSRAFETKEEYAKHMVATLMKRLSNAPEGSEVFPGESMLRLGLFMQSLDFGMSMLDEIGEILTVQESPPFNIDDASLLFGPDMRKIPAEGCAPCTAITLMAGAPESPFLKHYIKGDNGNGFLQTIRDRASCNDRYTLFSALFKELAETVGSSCLANYELNWPYSNKQIKENPYLRLRIGPTFEDLVVIMSKLWDVSDSDKGTLRNQVSALLDWAIDEGAVVPTIAEYENQLYRIYRKGEEELRDNVANRVVYALDGIEKGVSLTRLAKILAILGFSQETEELLLPSSLPRGNVATFPTTSVDKEQAEISHYLRDIGRIKKQ